MDNGATQDHPTGEPAPLLSLRGICVLARNSGRILLKINELVLSPGERVVITGPSGSGKSLLLSTISGRWAAGLRFSGIRTFHGSRIGLIPQRGLDALHPLVPLGRQLRAVTGAAPGRVADVLTSVGLEEEALHRRRPAELSGGQSQRAAVALAVLTRAPLILADEPTSALDHDSRDRTLALIRRVVGIQQTLVVVTHDPAVAASIATRHLRIERGSLTELPVPPCERTMS